MFEPAGADADSTGNTRAGHGRRLLASAAILGAMVVVVKLVAFAKDWLVALRFGASDDLDAFLVALIIPSYAVAVLAHSFGPAFVPTYIRLTHAGEAPRAGRLVGSLLLGGPALLVAITLVLALAAPWLLPLVGTGFDAAKLALAQSLFYVVAAIIVASGTSGILSAVLNSEEHFAITAAAPLAVPATTVVVFWLGQERFGIFALAVGTMAGFVVECAVLAVVMGRRGLLPRPRWSGLDANLKHVGAQYVPVAVGALLMSSSLVVDQAMAASLGSGSVSILSYGNKMVALVLGMVAASLSTVLFPRFSRLIAQGQWDELERTFRGFCRLVVVAGLPGVALLVALSEPLMRLVFERGAFTPGTTAAAAEVQCWLAPQIPFYVLGMVGARLLSALDGNRLVLWIGALNLMMNVAGNLLFMRWFGVKGIAMSTSLMYGVAMLATLLAIRSRLADARPRGT